MKNRLSQIQRDGDSVCRVALYGHRTDRYRSAKSFVFAGINKTLKKLGVEPTNCL